MVAEELLAMALVFHVATLPEWQLPLEARDFFFVQKPFAPGGSLGQRPDELKPQAGLHPQSC